MLKPTVPRSFTSIPVIDVRPLVKRNSTISEKREVAKRLHDACSQVGFFYAINHGISTKLQNDVRQYAREWFALPEAMKRQIKISAETHFRWLVRGYQALGENVTRYDGEFTRDVQEAIDFYKEMDVNPEESQIHGPNLWPVQHQQFASTLKLYFKEMEILGRQISAGISLGLGLEEDAFQPYSNQSYYCARVIHYPPLSRGSDHQSAREGKFTDGVREAVQGAEVERTVQLSCGEHSDYGMLTFVNQDDHVSALQVKNVDGKWIDAKPIPGSFVCNIGDMYRIWTNGGYTPTRHRVLNTDEKSSRVCVAYFFEPNFDALIKPLEGLASSNGNDNVEPIRYGTHLEKKVFSNFEFVPHK